MASNLAYDVTAWRNDVTAGVTTFQPSVPTRVPGGNTFHSSSVSGASTSGSGARSGYGGGRPASGRNAPASTRSAKITVSTLEVPDLTLNLPPAGDRPLSLVTLRLTETNVPNLHPFSKSNVLSRNLNIGSVVGLEPGEFVRADDPKHGLRKLSWHEL